MRVSFKFHSFATFVHGAPIISRYTHISKTEGGANETQPHCNQLEIDVLESVIFYPFSST